MPVVYNASVLTIVLLVVVLDALAVWLTCDQVRADILPHAHKPSNFTVKAFVCSLHSAHIQLTRWFSFYCVEVGFPSCVPTRMLILGLLVKG